MPPTWHVGPLVITEEGAGYRMSREKRSTKMTLARVRLLIFLANNADQSLTLEQIVRGLWPVNVLSVNSVRILVSQIRCTMAELNWKIEFERRLQWDAKRGTYLWLSRPSDAVTTEQSLPAPAWVERDIAQQVAWRSALDGAAAQSGCALDSALSAVPQKQKMHLRVGDRVCTKSPVPNFAAQTMLPVGSSGVARGFLLAPAGVYWATVVFQDVELAVVLGGMSVRKVFPSYTFNMPINWLKKI